MSPSTDPGAPDAAAVAAALSELQTEYDAYVSSSREIEEELESSLESLTLEAASVRRERDAAIASAGTARAEASGGAEALSRARTE
eukprot:CAMPEP_0194274010 /NCGR_PEP_ID=MMETSP0169-20130528/7209_1 /TAXON_ID=218684 /ORGANISM="Corethron pennatum, Strain L29A3" /LENGTH=85 /DNA_ID=CAMNT_0039017105 /DNA_START=191 /DNA_END=445 /DNA_ORIENTATION=+